MRNSRRVWLAKVFQWKVEMGAARSALTRTVQTPRQTQKQIDKVLDRQPTLAPKHETTKDLLDAAKQENEANFQIHNRRSEEYLDLLKQIRVHSVDGQIKKPAENDEESTSTAVTSGKLTSEQLTFLFQQRLAKREEWSAEKIASHFHLPLNSVENLLKYHSNFNVQEAPKIPEPLAEITH